MATPDQGTPGGRLVSRRGVGGRLFLAIAA